MQNGHDNVFYIPEKDNIIPHIVQQVKDGDAVVVMGAGNIWEIAPKILETIRNG
jgi:UDP-N-acetylmuramate-alanine ligase